MNDSVPMPDSRPGRRLCLRGRPLPLVLWLAPCAGGQQAPMDLAALYDFKIARAALDRAVGREVLDP